jgi:hypothetical protein
MRTYHIGDNLTSLTLVSENYAAEECNLAYHLYYSQSKRRAENRNKKFLWCKMKSVSLEQDPADCFHCIDYQPLIKHQGFIKAVYKYYGTLKTAVKVAYQLTTPSFSADLAFHILIFISSEPQRMYLLSIDHRTHVSLCIRFV